MDASELLFELRKETLQLGGELHRRLDEIEKILGRARRPLATVTKRTHVEVTARYRNGICPCCHITRVCSEDALQNNANFDHYFGAHKNSVEETWLVCSGCNQRLEADTTFKNAKDAEFKAYQSALKQYLHRPTLFKVDD